MAKNPLYKNAGRTKTREKAQEIVCSDFPVMSVLEHQCEIVLPIFHIFSEFGTTITAYVKLGSKLPVFPRLVWFCEFLLTLRTLNHSDHSDTKPLELKTFQDGMSAAALTLLGADYPTRFLRKTLKDNCL